MLNKPLHGKKTCRGSSLWHHCAACAAVGSRCQGAARQYLRISITMEKNTSRWSWGGALCVRHVGGGVGDGGGGVGRDSSTVHCVVTIRSPSRLATDRGVQPDPHPWAAHESVASLAWMGGGCCVGRGGGTTFRDGRAAAGVLTRLHAGRRHRCRGELLPRSLHPSAAPPSVTSSAGGWVGEREGLTAEASDQQAETSDQQAETSTPGRIEGYLAIKIALPDKQFGLRTPPTDSNLETYLANQEHHSRDLINCYTMGTVYSPVQQ